MKKPIIYRYFDYIEFIRDWFDYLKSGQSRFSFRTFAKEVGVSSAYISMVLAGKRGLTPKMLNKIIPGLKLSSDEEVYLELLVLLGVATSQDAKMRYLRLMEQNVNYQKYNQHESEAYRYLTHWYYVAIREMTGLKDFSDDPDWIAKRLKFSVSKAEITKALKFLLSNKFIEKGKDGNYIPPDKTIECYDGIFKLVLAQFHKEMFDLGIKSIHNTEREFRNIKGHTFSIKNDQVEKAKAIIDKAEVELMKLGTSTEEGDIVMQGQLALFPLTQIEGEDN